MYKSWRPVDVLIYKGDIKEDGKNILEPFKKEVSRKKSR